MKDTLTLESLLNEYCEIGVDNIINYDDYNKILITTHSTKIEGSTLSFEEACELIQYRKTPVGKDIDFSLMVLDHHDALNFILEEAGKNEKLSVEFIQKIASKVMKNTGKITENVLGIVDSSKGEFRKNSVRAGNTIFMNYQKVEPALYQLIEDLKQKFSLQKTIKDKLELSFYAHYELVNIHPFLDGNGRTARLLMNFIQRKYSLPLGIVFSEDKINYYKVLASVRETETYDNFYDFMFQQYKKFLQLEINKIKETSGES